MHAVAAIDPVFIESLTRAEKQGDDKIRRLCLGCHSPVAVALNDLRLKLAVSREGVTCDFCHTVKTVNLSDGNRRFTNNPGPVKMGPGGKDFVPPHKLGNNYLLMQSEFCAACHEWENPRGLMILGTYSEWKASFYPGEKVSCQQCHMPGIATTVKTGDEHSHTFWKPDPNKTVTLGKGDVKVMPNACNICHTDKKPEDLAAALKK
jgi:hypothetical protein